MSKLMLTIRDSRRSICRAVPGSGIDVVVAALSVEPETIEELEAGMSRFVEPVGAGGFFDGWSPGICDTPKKGEACIIDLEARLVVSSSRRSSPARWGRVAYHDGARGRAVWLWYHVSDDWLFSDRLEGWQSLAKKRRDARGSLPPLDARSVLYGKLAEFLASGCLEMAAQPSRPADAIARIHARWLMTPREDLGGQSPREVLLARREHIAQDLEDRSAQWSRLGRCPPGLSKDSAAFRWGGFGTHENVLYYELVRALLAECWERAQQRESLDLGEETSHLQRRQEAWLITPQEDLEGCSPAEVIERERLRLPLVVTGEHAAVDDDCPLCRMLAEDPGPVFWHLDGCNMDDDFPFSFHRTREEWEADRAEWDAMDREFEQDRQVRQAAGQQDQPLREAGGVWDRSYVSEDPASQRSAALRVFGIGTRLSELIADLKQSPRPGGRPLIETLNRGFSNLRETLFASHESLIEPVAARLGQDLDEVALAYPKLADKCCALQQQLAGLTRSVQSS